MKIAMIGHKRMPGREGGIEVVVEELSTRMVTKGHIVHVYNRSKKGVDLPKEYKGVKVIKVPTIEKKSTDAVVYSLFATLSAVFKHYDVIHFHAIGPSFFVFIPHLLGFRTVVTVHGLNYKTPKWKGFGAKFIKAGERNSAKYADEIIVLSKEQQNYFKEKYNRDTKLIPNGTVLFDIESPEIITKDYGLEKDKFILFISRIVPGKGIEYLLDAYKQIDCDLPLVIAGGTEYVDEFYSMIEEKAAEDSRVKMIGFVEGKLLHELYSNAALFVFPSEAEGMPMCLLEALSYNCNCLVSDISENTEVGNKFVQSFKSCDTHDLKEKLEYCIYNLEEVFPYDSREYVKTNYDWDIIVDKTLECYKE